MNKTQKKYLWSVIILIMTLVAIIFISHLTPKMAIRSHVFMLGYPISAITSEIVEDVEINELNKEEFEEHNEKMYTISNPPVGHITKITLSTFIVKKKGIFYFAEYAGGV